MKTNITTKEALATASDEELLALFNDARAGRHTSGGVKNRETNVTEYDPVRSFQGYYGTEYSFPKLKTELEERGLIEAATKEEEVQAGEKKVFTINPYKPSIRCDLMVEKDVLAKFKKAFPNAREKRVHMTAALLLYMDAVQNGEVQVTLSLM